MSTTLYNSYSAMLAVEPIKPIFSQGGDVNAIVGGVNYAAPIGSLSLTPYCVADCPSQSVWANTHVFAGAGTGAEANANFLASSTFTSYGYGMGHSVNSNLFLGTYEFDNDEDGVPETLEIYQGNGSFDISFTGGHPVQFAMEMASTDQSASYLVQIFSNGTFHDSFTFDMGAEDYAFIGISTTSPMSKLVFLELNAVPDANGDPVLNSHEYISQTMWVDYNLTMDLPPNPVPLPPAALLFFVGMAAIGLIARRRLS